jgi:ligand-binding sensor domain-containing protein
MLIQFRRVSPSCLALFLYLVLLLSAPVAWSQHRTHWQNYLNSDRVVGIATHADDLWALTNGGITRIDRITGDKSVFNRANSGLATNQPGAVHAAADGALWVLQTGSEILRYDGSLWTPLSPPFPPYRLLTDNEDHAWIHDAWYTGPGSLARWNGVNWVVLDASFGLECRYATAIVRDDQDALWVAAYPTYYLNDWHGGGLARFDGAGWTTFTYADSALSSNFVTSLGLDLDGSLWVGALPGWTLATGDHGGLTRYDGVTWTNYHAGNSLIPSENVRSLVIDAAGAKWLATDVGVVCFDGTTWTLYDTNNSNLPSNNVTRLHLDPDGNLWTGTGDAGLAQFVAGNWVGHDLSNSPFPQSQYSQSQYLATVLQSDPLGNVWAGLHQYGGVLKITSGAWSLYNTANSPLPHDQIFDIAFDLQGRAWIATPEGAASFDGVTWQIHNESNGLQQDYARTVDVHPGSGHVWVGNQRGLVEWDGVSWTHYDTANSGLPSNYIESIAFAPNGDLFVSTRNVGNFGIVECFDGNTWTEVLRTDYEVPGALIVDATGVLWATWPNWGRPDEGGIVRFDGGQPVFYNTSNSAIPTNLVQSLGHDGTNLWVGTVYDGVIRFDGQTWTMFDPSNSGITDERVHAIAVGADGMIWLGGEGISVYNSEVTSVGIDQTDARTSLWLGVSGVAYGGEPCTIHYRLSQPGRAALSIFDVRGRLVRAWGLPAPGPTTQSLTWNGRGAGGRSLARGVYFIRLSAQGTSCARKLTLLKR